MKIRRNKNHICYLLGIILYFISFLGALLFPSLTYLTYQRLARRGFLLSLLLSIIADFFLLVGKRYISKSTKQQMLSIYIIAVAFFLPMFLRSLIFGNNTIFGIYNWIELLFVMIGLFFWTSQLIGTNFSIRFSKNSLILLIIVAVVIFVSIEQLSVVIKGDSIEYYSKIIRICQNFSFNPNDISLLKSSGHCCYSYSLFSTIGENILPYSGLGVRIENIVIWILSIIFVWKSLKIVIADASELILLGCVSCFAFTPLILGNIQEISVENYVLLFFILFFYCNISKKHLLEMFFAICFVFAKEPDILILAGYYIGMFINQSIMTITNKKQNKSFFDKDFLLSSFSVYIAAIAFCTYFAVDTSWGNNVSFDDVNKVRGNTFGINAIYIISKLKHLFILNFAWIFTATIIVGLALCILKKKLKNGNGYFIPLFFSYVCFLIVQLFYLTYVLPRYIMLQYFYLIFGLAIILNKLAMNYKILKYAIPVCIAVLLCQNYYNIDPISYLVFDMFDTGTGFMIFDNPLYIGINGELITYKDDEIPYIQPYGMTNKQFSYFDRILEIALKEINYSNGDLIIFPRSFNLYADNFYWGNHLDLYYYDTQSKCFKILVNEYVPNTDHLAKLYIYQTGTDYLFNDLNNYKNVYYFSFSFSNDIDNFVHENYQTDKLKNLNYRGWSLDIYSLEEKD